LPLSLLPPPPPQAASRDSPEIMKHAAKRFKPIVHSCENWARLEAGPVARLSPEVAAHEVL
jgi:hypothetical protein